MKKILLLAVTLLLAKATFSSSNITVGNYRWRNDNGSQITATYRAAENTQITLTNREPFRLRLQYGNATGGTLTLGIGLYYPDVIPFATQITASPSNAFVISGVSNGVADLEPTTQLLSTYSAFAGYNFVPGSEFVTSFTKSDMLAASEFREYEFVIKPGAALLPNTTYSFYGDAFPSPGSTLPTLTTISAPAITSFSPASGVMGSPVVITGDGFSATPANNIVRFGGTKAVVVSASATSLSVIVPLGATYAPIYVLNTETAWAGQSNSFFQPVFAPGKPAFLSADIAGRVNFPVGGNPQGVTLGDLDGDGKNDAVIANGTGNTVSVLRNISTLKNPDFSAKIDLVTATQPRGITLGDLDGDGKPEIIVSNSAGSSISVFRNTSNIGLISFDAKIDFTAGAGSAPLGVAVADVDLDGKLDIAVVGQSQNGVYLFRNTSAPGSITLASPVLLSGGVTPDYIAFADFDLDGKKDIVISSRGTNEIIFFKNTSSPGSPSFLAAISFATGTSPKALKVGDIDGDGKMDVVVDNGTPNATVSVLRNNNTTPGVTSFDTFVSVATPFNVLDLSIGDVNADGKLDLVTANSSNTMSVLRNVSTPGTVIFAAGVNLIEPNPILFGRVAIGDIDNDGKSDLVTSNAFTDNISVFRNKPVSLPTATTLAATNVTQNTVTLNGLVNDGDGATTVTFKYSTFSDLSFATSASGGSVAAETGPTNVSANLGALPGLATYYYRVEATNEAGTMLGSPILSFSQTLPQTITFNALPAKTFGDAPFALTATGGASGNPVTYISSNTAVATVSGSTVTIVGGGTTNITASQAGNGTYSAAPNVIQPLTVNKANQTISFTTVPSKTFGDAPFTLAATSTSGLPVTFGSGTPATGTVSGNTVTIVGAGALSLSATQAGNTNYNSAAPVFQTINVAKANQTISFAALPAKTFGDAAFSLSATGGQSGNTVTFVSSNTAVATVSGNTVTIVGAGSTNITASQASSANYNAAADVVQLLTVNKANQTISFAAIPAKTYGNAPFTVSAAGGASGNAVTFVSSNSAVATISGTTVTIVGAGNTNITASQAGGANYNAAADVIQPLTVNKANLTVTATAQAKTYDATTYSGGNGVTFTGFVGSDNAANSLTGTLVYTGNSQGAKDAGSYVINPAGYASVKYNLSYVNGSLTVNKVSLNITPDDKVRGQNAPNPPLTASYTGFVGGETSAVLSTQATISTTATQASPPGNYSITASGAVAANYNITYINGTLTVLNNIAPTDLALSKSDINENNAVSAVIGLLSSTDPDAGNTFTYSLAAGTGSTDNASFTIVNNELRAGAAFNFEAKAFYSVRIRTTDNGGLSFEKVFTISINDVNEIPTLAVISDLTICGTTTAQTVSLAGISAGPDFAQATTLSVSSNNPSLFSQLTINGSGNTGTVNYTLAGITGGTAVITVTVADNGGTANGGVNVTTRSFTLSVNPTTVGSVSSSLGTNISLGFATVLTATGGTSYSWANAAGIISGQNTSTLIVRPTVSTTYTVTISNASGCSVTQSITLNVLRDFKSLDVTNIMTPNGDGVNDFLIIKNIDLYPGNTLRIFDRAGRVIYTKQNYTNDWGGTYKGLPLTEGTYYYILDFGPGFGKIQGFVTILREQ